MDISMINVDKYESLHSADGYELAASAEVYVPFFRCTLKCMCEEHTPMSELDKAVCTCIERGISIESEISFVLSLDSGIIKGELERLIEGGILSEAEETLAFTDFGKQCYSRKMRAINTVVEYEVLMNAVTGEWMTTDDEDDGNKLLNESVDGGVCLPPVKTVSAMDIENNDVIRNRLGQQSDVSVLRMSLMERKTVEYYKEIVFLYENNNSRVLFEIYDPSKDELDLMLSSRLRQRYEKKEILELIKAGDHLKYAKDSIIEENNNNHPSATINSKDKEIRYLKNREIREMLLKQLDESKKHLFIISPWISDFVVNDEMLNKFENALKRGVIVEIGYGYIPIEKMKWRLKKHAENEARATTDKEKKKAVESKKKDKDVTSVEMAKELEKRFSKYENFTIQYIKNGSHEKFLSYDDNYVYIGSMNLLSYDGGEKENYQGFNFRFEGGILLEDKQFANERMEDFRSVMVPFNA